MMVEDFYELFIYYKIQYMCSWKLHLSLQKEKSVYMKHFCNSVHVTMKRDYIQ